MRDIKVIFLGTCAAIPTLLRNGPSFIIKIRDELLLFECSDGTFIHILRAGLNHKKINKIFLSHLHGDCYGGLLGFVYNIGIFGRKKDLHIYGPDGTKDILTRLFSIPNLKINYNICIHELNDNYRIEFKNFKVHVKSVDHTIPTMAYAIEERKPLGKFNKEKAKTLGIPEGPLRHKLQHGEIIKLDGRIITPSMVLDRIEKNRKIVYSGDTRPCDSLTELAEGCDALIHDSTYLSRDQDKAKKYKHSTAKEAAEIAKQANVQKLFLFHTSARYEDKRNFKNDSFFYDRDKIYVNVKEILFEARKVFKNALLARDGQCYQI